MRPSRLFAHLFVLVVACAVCAAASPRTVVAAREPAAAIPAGGRIAGQYYDKQLKVTKTRLANGLVILSKEDHAAPVAYFSVFYKVGSRNEITGQTGLSHILEHMMFKGTHDLPPGSIARLFQLVGGEINAATDIDETYYHELISADKLELAVRVEADRMENSAFDPVQLSHEMTVVRSELEGDSNDPGQQLRDFTFDPLAFISHPYHWPTIGWIPDVENAAKHRDEIYNYYKGHYMPNNATVVVVGDFDTAQLVRLCQQYFGVYNTGVLERHFITPEPPQHGERRGVLRRPGTVGQVMIGWRGSVLGSADHYTMDVISLILSSGRSSRLYQALVEPGIADGVDAGNYDTHDPFVFTVSATAAQGVSDDKLEAGMEAEVDRLKTDPVSLEELNRAKRQIEAGFTYNNDSVSDQAQQLGFYQTVFGDYRYLATYLKRIDAVTPQMIQDVAKRYFTVDQRTVASFEPVALPPGTAPPPFTPIVHQFGAVSGKPTAAQQKMVSELETRFTSGKRVAAKSHVLPSRIVLPNGLVLLVQSNHANKTVAMTGLVRAGAAFDPDDKPGLSEMTSAMLSRGAAGKTALEIARSLEGVGASIDIGANVDDVQFGGKSLTKDFDLMVSTLSDELRRPDFPSDQLEKLRGQMLGGIDQERQDAGGTGGPGAVGAIAFAQALYPPHHPYWQPTLDAQQASIKSMTRDDLVGFYGKYYRPDTMALVIVGDVTRDEAVREVQKCFGDWARPAAAPRPLVIPDTPLPPAGTKPIYATMPDVSQTSILFGSVGQLKRSDPDFYAATVMNYILGGSVFGSRLGDLIRDQNGLAYTVYSGFDAGHGEGPFQIFIGTNPENAAKALYLMHQALDRFIQGGATQTEVDNAVAYLTGSFPLTLETNSGLASVILAEQDYGLGLDYVNRRASLYRSVTVAQVDALAKRLLHPNRSVLVFSGAPPR